MCDGQHGDSPKKTAKFYQTFGDIHYLQSGQTSSPNSLFLLLKLHWIANYNIRMERSWNPRIYKLLLHWRCRLA